MSVDKVAEINAFWLGESMESPAFAAARRDWWYRGGHVVDSEIGRRFVDNVTDACEGKYEDWQQNADGNLALILLLDQFTRNLYRNTPEAYLGDPRAFEIVYAAIENGLDRELHPVPRIWLYHPFHHSESVEEQDRGIRLLHQIVAEVPSEWHPYVERSITGWTRHRNIVAQFGRFPHRNHVLGRVSTDEEASYLSSSGESFGQGPVRVNDPVS